MSASVQPISLSAIRDFVRPGEEAEYSLHCSAFQHDLNPQGILEEVFVAEIVTASWRLRRCSRLESQLADAALFDPMFCQSETGDSDETAARTQLNIDRARSQANNILRKSLAELRRIQTDRKVREAVTDDEFAAEPNLASYREMYRAVADVERLRLLTRKANGLDTFHKLLDRATAPPSLDAPLDPSLESALDELGSFCKTLESESSPMADALREAA